MCGKSNDTLRPKLTLFVLRCGGEKVDVGVSDKGARKERIEKRGDIKRRRADATTTKVEQTQNAKL